MNNVSLIGRLTKDPEVKYTQTNNTMVANFNLAVSRRFKKEGQPEADFINIVLWGKTAEFASKYFKKGQQVAIQGRIQTRTWEDDNSVKHYATEVVAENVYFADSKKQDDGGDMNFNSGMPSEFGNVKPTNAFDMSEDDLPF